MGKRLAWFGTTVIALAGIVIGVIPIDIGPRWLWLLIGVGFGLAAAFTFLPVWRPDGQAETPVQSKTVNQKPTMTAGDNSTQIVNQGGGTFNINKSKGS